MRFAIADSLFELIYNGPDLRGQSDHREYQRRLVIAGALIGAVGLPLVIIKVHSGITSSDFQEHARSMDL